MIGIILPSAFFSGKRPCLFADFNHYKDLAEQYGTDICFFSLQELKKDSPLVEALVYSPVHKQTEKKTIALPQINLVRNTSYIRDRQIVGKIKILQNKNFYFLNLPLIEQANKLKNCEFLQQFSDVKEHVPATKQLSFAHLNELINLYQKVIIKPLFGSKGRNITTIEKEANKYWIMQTSPGNKHRNAKISAPPKVVSILDTQLKSFYDNNFPRPTSFLVQQWIWLKNDQGLPFDLRAIVQRNGHNKWQLTSRVARMAGEKDRITNISQGGKMVSLSELKLKKKDRAKIRALSLKLAQCFAIIYPWSAEMGLDLALDRQGKLWYLETNFCPEKVRPETIYKIPFAYAYFLLVKQAEK